MTGVEEILTAFSLRALDRQRSVELLARTIAEGTTTLDEVKDLIARSSLFGNRPEHNYIELQDQLEDATRIRIEEQRTDGNPEFRGAPAEVLGSTQPQSHRTTSSRSNSTPNSEGQETVLDDRGTARTQLFGGYPTAPPHQETAKSTASGVLASSAIHLSDRQSSQTLNVGDTLKERFVLEELLGVGGMGVVFKALDLRKREANDRDPYVALKILSPEFRENPISFIALQREAKRAQALSHPNIINVFDFDRDGSHVFMSMEYLPDQPLSKFIRQMPEGGLSWERAWPIIKSMGSALAYAHKKKIVHSDFKPGNVFINSRDEIKVLDFGIACAAGRSDQDVKDETLYDPRSLGALTPAYASLEMFEGAEPDARDDIFALACVSYELLTGKHPYRRLTAQQAFDENLQPRRVRNISTRRWHALQHALALKRSDRTESVDTYLAQLEGRSGTYYAVWAMSLALFLISIGTYYQLVFRAQNLQARAPVNLTPQQQGKVKDLLELAQIHFDVGYLTAPPGSNALWAYQEVLKIDPYNDSAISGLKKISDTLEEKAWESFEKGERTEAVRRVNEGLQADPQHQGLISLKRKLQTK